MSPVSSPNPTEPTPNDDDTATTPVPAPSLVPESSEADDREPERASNGETPAGAEPDPQAPDQPEADLEAGLGEEAGAGAGAGEEAEPGIDAAETEPDVELEVEAEVEAEVEGEAEGEAGTEVEAEGEAGTEAEVQAESDAEGEATDAAGGKRKKRKAGAKAKEQPAPKPQWPTVGDVVRRVGTTNDEALAYVTSPDPRLSRIGRKVRDNLVPDLPPLVAGALLGPAALARHFVASSASGRYRDLFALWQLFRKFPDECKPVLAERSAALQRSQHQLRVATRLGLTGDATRVAADIERAEGLIWQWLREVLDEALAAAGARPAIASALLRKDPSAQVPLPREPDERWLTEAAAARKDGPLADPVEALLAAGVHRLPATVETLRLATLHYPDRVEALVDRVDLDAPDVGAYLAWARDHGADERLRSRIRDRVSAASVRDPADGLALWYRWRTRGVELPLPSPVLAQPFESYDLTRPETAELAARLQEQGQELNLQARLEVLAQRNRQLAEKAYEALVCARLDIELPPALEDNPIVREGTRCPNCGAWTWVRPGHEERCPRPPAPPRPPEPDPFELAAEALRDSP